MTQAQQEDLYGKVENGVIVEFPVTVSVIKARGHSLFNYNPVKFNYKPGYDDGIGKLATNLSIKDGHIVVDYSVTPLTLAEVLASFRINETTVKQYADIPMSVNAYTQSLLKNLVETKINQLANQRDFDSFDSAISRYSNSSDPKLKKEAAYLNQVLTEAWRSLATLNANLKSNAVALPPTVEAVEAYLGIPTNWNKFEELNS